MSRFGFGFPGQFPGQTMLPWNGNMMWSNNGFNGFPQIPQPGNGMWWNNVNGVPQIGANSVDPLAQWTALQDPTNQGIGGNINTINGINNINNPSSQGTLNTWAVQQGNQGLGLNAGNQFPATGNLGLGANTGNQFPTTGNLGLGTNTGNQFPTIPNNNGMVDPFAPFQSATNMAGSQWTGTQGLQGLQNNGFPNNGMEFASSVNGIGKKK